MKKFLTILAAAVLVISVSGCEKETKGNYKEGTYTAEAVDPYNNEGNVASAKLVVNADGEIESIYLDTTYTVNGETTTKKTLGNDYNMMKYNPNASGEWFEQVEKLEKYIVDSQGLGEIVVKEDSTTDAVSGCTIKVDALIAVTEDVLNQAKK